MQAPRRFTELSDNSNTALKRSKAQSITGPSPGGAIKFPSRKNRLAPVRSSSQENSLLQVPGSSCGLGASTSTPLTKTTARTLFSAEKRHGTVSSNNQTGAGGPLHNDKKWVQEQAQAIMQYLERCHHIHPINGLSSDFFSRNGLKSMTIKQFVAILNFFLDKISGNRFVIGNNHVEDTVKVLQKLNYPYQVNKSCLKTPNTQTSYGNIIVILNFLLELSPPETPEDGNFFDFEDNPEGKGDKVFLSVLMKDSAEGWNHWDEQRMAEFSACQQKTRNCLIQEKTGLQNVDELDANINHLTEHLRNLELARPALKSNLDHLQDELHCFNKKVDQSNKLIKHTSDEILKLLNKKDNHLDKINDLKKETNQLKCNLKKQKYSLQEFDQMVFAIDQLEYQKKIHQKNVEEMLNLSHEWQVKLSRKKKLLTDMIDNFNMVLRRVHYTSGTIDSKIDLQLSLNPDHEHIHAIMPALNSLREEIKNTIIEKDRKRQKLEMAIRSIKIHIEANLLPSVQRDEEDAVRLQNKLEDQLNTLEQENEAKDEKIKNLTQSLTIPRQKILQLQNSIKEKQDLLDKKMEEDRKLMAEIEENYKKHSQERKEHLEKVEEALDKAEAEADKLEKLLDEIDISDGEDGGETAEEEAEGAKCLELLK